ncbi:MAG TPA: hypothetical protein VL424_08510, partial [Pararobbsia sp.]|nr:hypothetical protein [Pararobbsia sp.]
RHPTNQRGSSLEGQDFSAGQAIDYCSRNAFDSRHRAVMRSFRIVFRSANTERNDHRSELFL